MGSWFKATARVGFLTWIWPTRHCGLHHEVVYRSQCWKNWAVSFNYSNNWGAIDLKMNDTVLNKKSTIEDAGSHIVAIAETAILWSFFLLRLLFNHHESTTVISRLMLIVATWKCWISYRKGYVGELILFSGTIDSL